MIQIPRLRNSDEQVSHDEEPPPERLGLIRLRTLFKTVGTNFDLYNNVQRHLRGHKLINKEGLDEEKRMQELKKAF